MSDVVRRMGWTIDERRMFSSGDRVRINRVGAERNPSMSGLEGTVFDVRPGDVVRVKFDGRVYVQPIHQGLLERI